MSDERQLLQRLLDGPVSGDALARADGQTRAAVWKRIEALREAGVAIQATPGRGYALAQPLSLLSADAILDALPPDARAMVASLEVAWSLESTSSTLLQRPAPAAPAVEVLLAERQTGGRGRQGRSWASPLAANLYLSLQRRFEGGLARLGGLSLVAGVAVALALSDLGIDAVRLKWPNDLVVERDGELRKLGGLLVEGGGEHGGPARAVIGLGLNVRMPEAMGRRIDQPWVDLAMLCAGCPPGRDAIAAAVLARLVPALARFDAEGLAPFLEAYAGRDVLAGRDIAIAARDRALTGLALGLAADGGLRVRTADGERVFHAGEASVRRR